MESQKVHLIVVLTLLVNCELIDTKGLCEFAEMFPSKGAESCFGHAKPAEDKEPKELTTRHVTPEPIAIKKHIAQSPPFSQHTTYQTENKTSSTDRSPTPQPSTKLTTDQPNPKHSSFETTKTVKPIEVTTKNLTTEPPSYLSKMGKATTDRSRTFPSTVQWTTDQPDYEQSTSTRPATVQLTEATNKRMTSTLPPSPPCAPHMVLGPSCDCERTCHDPTNCNCTGPVLCVCSDGFLMNNNECVPEQECGCYYETGGLLIADGNTYVNDDCTERCTCSNNQLRCNSTYACSPNATCRVRDAVRQCYCNDGYVGDGETCNLYTDCYDAYQAGHRQDDVFTILPNGWPASPFNVWCDMTTSGGGWTLLQSRGKGIGTHFVRNWQEYKTGFGSTFGGHWLGNEKIFYLTNQRNNQLRVDLVFSGGSTTCKEYSSFKICNESTNYRLIILGNSSETADGPMDSAMGRDFSTYDRDNDECEAFNCSDEHGSGGWWYSNKWCNACCNSDELTCFPQPNNCTKRCTKANLNGQFNKNYPSYKQMFWQDDLNIVSTEMKVRPAN